MPPASPVNELNAPRIRPGRLIPGVERGSFETLDLVVVRKRPTQPFKEPSHDTVTAALHRRHAVAQLRAHYPTKLCSLCRGLRPLFWAQPRPTRSGGGAPVPTPPAGGAQTLPAKRPHLRFRPAVYRS